VSVGVRTEAREVSCAEFQLPRQIRWPSGERTNWAMWGMRRLA